MINNLIENVTNFVENIITIIKSIKKLTIILFNFLPSPFNKILIAYLAIIVIIIMLKMINDLIPKKGLF